MREGSRSQQLQGTTAGFVSRALADLIDLAIVLIISGAVGLVFAGSVYVLSYGRATFPVLPPWVSVATVVVIAVAYLTYGWGTTGKSFGKQLLGLRVVDRVNPEQPGGRAFWRAVLCVAFLPGILWVLFSTQNASLQDLVLRTRVIYDWSAKHR